MAGTTLDRELTSARSTRVEFALATPADDPDIRRLLRENAMPGQIALTFEREPDYFADADFPGTEKQTIIAREAGRAVCVGNCSLRQRFVNGKPHRVGYLGGLRLDARVAGRFDILRRGYDFFRELQTDNPADYYFTSIAADNLPALKFLERGLPGMPAYEFVSEFVTLVLPVKPRAQPRKAIEANIADSAEVLNFLEEQSRRHQFAECWTAREVVALAALGLSREQFYCVHDAERICASAAIWDQRAFKQTVIQAYSPWLATARPAVNCFARLLGTLRLPPVGATLAQAFISHLAVDPQKPEALTSLILNASQAVADRGIEFLTVGFATDDPRLAQLRNEFRCREYLSRIYVVRWPDLGASRRDLDGCCLGLEVALL